MTVKITLNSKHNMGYHSHEHRDEIWTIISGKGSIILDGTKRLVHVGDVVKIRAGCKHTIIADTELKLIEVQLGKSIKVDDKHKYRIATSYHLEPIQYLFTYGLISSFSACFGNSSCKATV